MVPGLNGELEMIALVKKIKKDTKLTLAGRKPLENFGIVEFWNWKILELDNFGIGEFWNWRILELDNFGIG